MRILSYARIGLGVAIVGSGLFAGACSSSNNPSSGNGGSTSPTSTGNSTNPGVGTSTSANNTLSGGTTTSGASGSATSGATSAGGGDAGVAGDGGICPSGLQDKITTCTVGVDPSCLKGCGPDLPAGSAAPANLGTKTCTCTTGVYQCGNCVYENPLPVCYQEGASPPACDSTAVNKAACANPCTTGTGNDVCTMTSDAGKPTGCVCIPGKDGGVWTCATLPW